MQTAGTDADRSRSAAGVCEWLVELCYLGVCLSQRGSCIHQELADGTVALAGCLM